MQNCQSGRCHHVSLCNGKSTSPEGNDLFTEFKDALTEPFVMGIVLGLIAKLVDAPEITGEYPIFADIFGRIGIWVWAATLISIYSKKAVYAAGRSFVFIGFAKS